MKSRVLKGLAGLMVLAAALVSGATVASAAPLEVKRSYTLMGAGDNPPVAGQAETLINASGVVVGNDQIDCVTVGVEVQCIYLFRFNDPNEGSLQGTARFAAGTPTYTINIRGGLGGRNNRAFGIVTRSVGSGGASVYQFSYRIL